MTFPHSPEATITLETIPEIKTAITLLSSFRPDNYLIDTDNAGDNPLNKNTEDDDARRPTLPEQLDLLADWDEWQLMHPIDLIGPEAETLTEVLAEQALDPIETVNLAVVEEIVATNGLEKQVKKVVKSKLRAEQFKRFVARFSLGGEVLASELAVVPAPEDSNVVVEEDELSDEKTVLTMFHGKEIYLSPRELKRRSDTWQRAKALRPKVELSDEEILDQYPTFIYIENDAYHAHLGEDELARRAFDAEQVIAYNMRQAFRTVA